MQTLVGHKHNEKTKIEIIPKKKYQQTKIDLLIKNWKKQSTKKLLANNLTNKILSSFLSFNAFKFRARPRFRCILEWKQNLDPSWIWCIGVHDIDWVHCVMEKKIQFQKRKQTCDKQIPFFFYRFGVIWRYFFFLVWRCWGY